MPPTVLWEMHCTPTPLIVAVCFPAQLGSGTSAPTLYLTLLSRTCFDSNLFKKLTAVESERGTFHRAQEEHNAESEVSALASLLKGFSSQALSSEARSSSGYSEPQRLCARHCSHGCDKIPYRSHLREEGSFRLIVYATPSWPIRPSSSMGSSAHGSMRPFVT